MLYANLVQRKPIAKVPRTSWGSVFCPCTRLYRVVGNASTPTLLLPGPLPAAMALRELMLFIVFMALGRGSLGIPFVWHIAFEMHRQIKLHTDEIHTQCISDRFMRYIYKDTSI